MTRRSTALVIASLLFFTSRDGFAQDVIEEEEVPPEPAPPPPPPPKKDEPPAPEVKPVAPKPGPPIGIRLDGGYAARKLFTIPVTGADMGFGVGAQTSQYAAFWGAARVFYGETEYSLKTFAARMGGEAELVLFDRVRLGAGLSFFLVGVGRYVRDEMLLSWGFEGRLAARVDLFQPSGFAIFARGALEGAWEVYDGSNFWGPTIGLGVDFDVAGKRVRPP
jgi:hypothetical protein